MRSTVLIHTDLMTPGMTFELSSFELSEDRIETFFFANLRNQRRA